MHDNRSQIRAGYDHVADEYARRFFHELDQKPLDRSMLDHFTSQVGALGPICDIGCGPGHVTHYLYQQGMSVLGLDLSPRMIELARFYNPEIPFQQGDMSTLDIPDGTWGGIVAFYSIIHIPRPHITAVLKEFWRVLRPGGGLLLAFHQGQEVRHIDEWWGYQVSIDFTFFERSEMENYLRAAHFTLQDYLERAPYEGVEVATRRVYMVARKPDSQ